jgi:hypothetical protein
VERKLVQVEVARGRALPGEKVVVGEFADGGLDASRFDRFGA